MVRNLITVIFLFISTCVISQIINKPNRADHWEAGEGFSNTHYLHFSGTTSSFNIPNEANYDIGADNDFSYGFWMRAGSTESPATNYNFSKSTGYFSRTTPTQFYFAVDDGTLTGITYSSTPHDSTWHCIAFVWDDTKDSLFIYHNGVNTSKKYLASLGAIDNATALMIGGRGSNKYTGAMDEMWWSLTAVSPADILSIYGTGISDVGNVATILGANCDSWWDCNEGSSTLVEDSGDLGNDGTINLSYTTWETH